ncbi:hypothetical protein B0H19DRAFT_1058241 [Mycena capillaripes]|nr:hypothetical protein B0H19DRAFT_1058241 [Mycena capillaripes]
MARLVGVDPKKPGGMPLWRGHVVVVKMQEWPGPLVRGGGAHMDYVDTPPPPLNIFSYLFIPRWYKSDEWAKLLQEEKDFNDQSLKSKQEWPMFQTLYPMLSSTSSGFDKKKYGAYELWCTTHNLELSVFQRKPFD